jgi:DNA-binding transcriptional regulator YiaG
VPRCEDCGDLIFDNWADQQITHALREAVRLLPAEEIQNNRTDLGLSRSGLAERLGVEEETLAAWEEGRLLQPRLADNLLRHFFALPQVRAALAETAR